MLIYLLRRVAYMVLVLFGISLLIFFLARVIPGDPARLALGPEAPEEHVEHLRRLLGLDQPLYVQYYRFVKGLFQGKLGISLITRRDVSKDLLERFPATFELVSVAMLIAVLGGVPLGVISALHKDKIIDYFSRIFAFAGVSFPRFWIGIMLQLTLAYTLGLLPIAGRISTDPPSHITGLYLVDSLLTRNFPAFLDSLKHILLPAITLSLSPLAQITRLIRANMIEQLRKDYTIVARTIGMPENLNVYKYMLKNAFTSTLTLIGLITVWMLGYAFLVEQVFAWPGMARYGVNSVLRKDFNAVVGVTLVIGLGYVVINFIVDLLYGYLDPRIRLKK
jgi:peptide/nickel transport system permease protein